MALCPTSLCFSSLAVPSAMPQNVSLEVVNSRVSLPVFNISWPVIPAFGRLCISTICISSLLCGWIWFWEAFRFSFPRCQMPPMPQNVLIRKKKPSYSISPAEVGGSRWMRLAWGAVNAKNQGIKEEFAPPWLFGCFSGVLGAVLLSIIKECGSLRKPFGFFWWCLPKGRHQKVFCSPWAIPL